MITLISTTTTTQTTLKSSVVPTTQVTTEKPQQETSIETSPPNPTSLHPTISTTSSPKQPGKILILI